MTSDLDQAEIVSSSSGLLNYLFGKNRDQALTKEKFIQLYDGNFSPILIRCKNQDQNTQVTFSSLLLIVILKQLYNNYTKSPW